MRRHLPLVLVLLVVASGTAAAASLVLVEGPHDRTFRPASAEPVELDYTLRNVRQNPVDWFVDVEAPPGWETATSPPNGTIQKRGFVTVSVTLEPTADAESGDGTVSFTIFERNESAHQQVDRVFHLEPQSPPVILGVLPNPLPPPLSGVAGTVLLNALAWSAVVVGAAVAAPTALRRIGGTRRTGNRLLGLVRPPLVAFLVFWGLLQTVRLLAPTRPVVIVAGILETIRLVVGVWLGFRVFRSFIIYYRHRVAPRTQYELDDMVIPLMEKLGAAFFVAAGFLLLLRDIGVDVGVLLAAGGFASIIIGFAAQNTLSNFFSGINILLDQPFREGDDLELETGEVVRVEDIGLRTTRLYHYRQHDVVILPNDELATKRVVNLIYPDERYRWEIEVGVAYGSDTDLVEKLLFQAADEHPEVLSEEGFQPMVFFDGFGDSSLEFTLRFFIDNVRERWRIAADIRDRIDTLFRENGVTIPFPQRTHWFKSTLHHQEGPHPTPGGVADDEPPDDEAAPSGDAPEDEAEPSEEVPGDRDEDTPPPGSPSAS